MTTNKSFIRDFIELLLTPKRFFESRFLRLEQKRIFLLGFIGVFLGLLVGSLSNYAFADFVAKDFLANNEPYLKTLQTLGLKEQSFLELLKTQQAYSLLLAILSPAIAYMAPHILGGALFIFLKLLSPRQEKTISFLRVLECSAISLTAMFYYILPAIGSILAIVMIAINVSRALFKQYQIIGVMKIISILSALYIGFFIASATLQLLTEPFSKMLQN